LGSRFKYGVIGAGAVSASLIGQLPSKTHEIGPVSAASYRVASRIANTLRAGHPVRTADELNGVSCVLFHAPADQAESLIGMLEAAAIDWTGKSLIFCDCTVPSAIRQRFKSRGASVAVAREFGIAKRVLVEAEKGRDPALQTVLRIARQLHRKAIEISPDASDKFDAAVTLGTATITSLIDRTAGLLRDAGLRDTEAAGLAASLFEQTAREYAHSGKQSWRWYVRKPGLATLRAQLRAAGPQLEPVLRQLLMFSFETFQKHTEAVTELQPQSPAIQPQAPALQPQASTRGKFNPPIQPQASARGKLNAPNED
jgi:hypothetical protein